MRFRFNKNKSQPEKITKYSIRKFHFGAASVAVASLLFFGNGSVQAADNVVSQATANPNTHQSEPTTSSGGNSSGDSGSAGKPDASATTAAAQVTPTPTATTVAQPTTSAETEKSTEAPKTEVPSATTTPAPAEAVPSATSTTSNAGENGALSSNEQPAPATANEADNAEEKAAKEKVDVTALQTALTDLEDKLSKLKEESKKDSYKTLVTEAKKVVDDHEVTKETADKQLELVETAIKEVEEAIKKEAEQAKEEQPKEENPTPKKRGKGKRGAEIPAPKEELKALPTYTNGAGDTGTYALAEEMRKIVTYLRKNGADESEIASIKANYDKLNEKLGLTDENAVLSEADFAAATANLKAARDFTEAFLRKQDENGQPLNEQPTVPGTERSVGDGLNRQTRQAGKSFADSIEYFIDDGKQETPYSKYTYVFHTMKQSGVNDWGRNEKVSNGQRFIHARTEQNREGFSWDILVNEGGFNNYSTNSFWFTIPNGQNYVNNSVEVTKVSTGEKFTGSTIESALQAAGLGRVTKGTPADSGVFRSGMGAGPEAYRTGSLNDLARESVDTLIDKGLYRRAYETAADQKESNEKFDRIVNSGGSLYYFEIPERTGDSYRITFRTKGNNLPKNLVYAVGSKAVMLENALRVRALTNQWHAQTDKERDSTDRFPMKLKGNGTFLIDQDHFFNKGWPSSAATLKRDANGNPQGTVFGNVSGTSGVNIDNIESHRGLVTYGGAGSLHAIDFTSYVMYEGYENNFEAGKQKANNDYGQDFVFFNKQGNTLSKEALGKDAGETPGLHKYKYKRTFRDGSTDDGYFNIATRPKNPTIVKPQKFFVGSAATVTVKDGNNGKSITLFREYVENGVTKTEEISTTNANSSGVATFNLPTVKEGKYYARSIIKTDEYLDYTGAKKNTVESDLVTSDNQKIQAVVPPEVRVQGQELSETREGARVLYEVIQGERFFPRVEAWDDKGNLTKFNIDNMRPGITSPNTGSNFRPISVVAVKTNSSEARFTGNVALTETPGEYTSKITVADESGEEKDYFYKYRIIKRDTEAPTVTMNGNALTENASANRFVVYRGATFNPTFVVNDNSGTVSSFKINNVPEGVWFNKNGGSDSPKENLQSGTSYQLATNNTVSNTANLGTHDANVVVRDAQGNEKTYKFQYTVVDVQPKNTPKTVEINSQLGNAGDYLKAVDSNTGTDVSKYLPDNATYSWKEGQATIL